MFVHTNSIINLFFFLQEKDEQLERIRQEKEEEERRRMEVLQTFRTAPFEEIVARSEAKVGHLPARNSHVFLIP